MHAAQLLLLLLHALLLTHDVLQHQLQVPAQLNVVVLVHICLHWNERPVAQAACCVVQPTVISDAEEALPASYQQRLQTNMQQQHAGKSLQAW